MNYNPSSKLRYTIGILYVFTHLKKENKARLQGSSLVFFNNSESGISTLSPVGNVLRIVIGRFPDLRSFSAKAKRFLGIFLISISIGAPIEI